MRNRYTAKRMRLSAAVALVLIAAVTLYKCGSDTGSGKARLYYVKRVIDGDTILLNTGERVRYIGINTPEIHHPTKGVERLGHEAADFNQRLVGGKWVRLEFDIEPRDRYGRLLAYVYAGDVFVNAELVREGYAEVYTFPPNVKHADLFLDLQRAARSGRKGLWNKP
ncbi:MAG: thermonuclease family protein [Candidatus Omnitrophota bacterium]